MKKLIPFLILLVVGTAFAKDFGDVNIKGDLNVDGSVTNTEIDANTTHKTSTGADHSYIDQSVVSGATPTFTLTNSTGLPTAGMLDDAVTADKIDSTINLVVGTVTTTPAANPCTKFNDSDVAGDEEAKICEQTTGTDAILSIDVDVAGTPTTFMEIDGVSETVDILKPLVVTGDVSATTATITGLATSGTISAGAGGMTVDADGDTVVKSITGTGTVQKYSTTFTDATLSAGVLTVTHSLTDSTPHYFIRNADNIPIQPDEVTATDANTLTITLASWGDIGDSNWTVEVWK